MVCNTCQHRCRKQGRNRNGSQRYRCGSCGATNSDERLSLFGDFRVPEETAVFALHLLCEGSGVVPATSRVTGLHKGTILRLLVSSVSVSSAT